MRCTHLHLVRPSSRVLILGGGTGACLESLPAGCEVDFVDRSSKMIAKARRRRSDADVSFISADFLSWQVDHTYDFVLAPFFLDAFAKSRLKEVANKIRTLMQGNGSLIVTDFRPSDRVYHRFLLWAMHRFFRLAASLESVRLLDLHAFALSQGFQVRDFRATSNDFIYSAVYRPHAPERDNAP